LIRYLFYDLSDVKL